MRVVPGVPARSGGAAPAAQARKRALGATPALPARWVETESGDQGITYMVNVLNEPLNREHGQQKDYDEVKTILKEGKGDLIKRITNQRCWQIRETLETEYLYPGHSAFLFKNGWEVSEDFTLKLTFDALKVTGETGSDKTDALNFWDKDIIEELEYMLKDVTFEMPGADFDPDAKWIESVAGEKNPEPNRTIYMTQARLEPRPLPGLGRHLSTPMSSPTLPLLSIPIHRRLASASSSTRRASRVEYPPSGARPSSDRVPFLP